MTNKLQNLPKVELHSHLDCSMSFNAVSQLVPGLTEDEYFAKYVAPPHCTNLAHYLEFTRNCVDLLQSRDALQVAVDDLFEQLVDDNVIYSEIRFAPHLHTAEELNPYEIVKTVEAACDAAVQRTGVEARIILCTLCHYPEETSLEVAHLLKEFEGSRVVALDLAGDEAGFPLDIHASAFRFAIENNLPRIAHAGEALGAENVWRTLETFQPARIGHGIHSIEDPKLIEHLRETRVHLEVCPQCNVQTGSIPSLPEHPVDRLYHAGINMSISTDTRGITNTTLTEEYQRLVDVFGWTPDYFLQCNFNAVESSFIPAQIKTVLKKKLEAGYRACKT